MRDVSWLLQAQARGDGSRGLWHEFGKLATGCLSTRCLAPMSALREWHSWVDGHINVKGVYRRLQVAARFLVVGTFADDSIRVTFDYSGQVSTMQSVGFGLPLASILPAVFIMTQGISVFLIISEIAPEPGCVALLVWTGLHPFIYKQESNPRAGLGLGPGPGLGLGLGPERAPA